MLRRAATTTHGQTTQCPVWEERESWYVAESRTSLRHSHVYSRHRVSYPVMAPSWPSEAGIDRRCPTAAAAAASARNC
ncbi:hypothetical protein ANCDUO_17842 [Ancylostoma duodenale]|uniref:Uncharacterized protein n=1 Tax=Ancylostoma duodenale TaxID=51022 RepID=A0A0C2CQK0_9BILA|nr:hypothetical protein ANCDUO_17842 [Ancylostoma duodenale]